MNQEIPTSQQQNNQIQQSSANNGTISSQSSDTWCLERAIDEFIYDNSCTGPIPLSCTQHTDNPIQLVESVRPNANNISPDIQIADSASTKNYRGNSKPLVAADVNRELVPSGAEVTSTMENGRRITNYSVQLVKQHTVYQQWKGNYIRGNASGSGNNSDTVFGMQNTQLPNYSGIDYRPQRQVCLNGVAHTEMLNSDYIETNKDELNTKMPLCGTAGLTKFSYDQILRNFNKLKFGRAVRGRVPMTSGIKTELASTGNQNISPEEYVGSSKPVENSASPNDKTGINVRVGGKQKLSLGKCLPNIRCGPASDVNSSSCASGNAETDTNDHSHVFNPAPGGPVYVHERNDIVSDGDKMNHATYPFWKIL
ncbi:hypothetical protein L798_14795 [Zootermopsis nevadensis]|uniref:Uncharacterized protein n=2 Tax=Zootermopsis nevadensis TaxID=136037 RepID=A0A067RIS6_ZOONE|nr:hypothetical protein L798_14795 [Zootermopsis nevadensis]